MTKTMLWCILEYMKTKILIIGGGASGLAAAALLSRNKIPAVIIERNPRVGKKLLATGNGRCNLGNSNRPVPKPGTSGFASGGSSGKEGDESGLPPGEEGDAVWRNSTPQSRRDGFRDRSNI